MTQSQQTPHPFDRRDRYAALMEVIKTRMTNRAFAPTRSRTSISR